ncbi:MAG: class I SAM-dependent methyltransferase [Solirubrobacteraceae bacterium]
MPDDAETRSLGTVFDGIATEYDRHRPAYPDDLIDHACDVAGLEPGAQVLEIGCGTGQLTRSLVARCLRVTAVEPGDHLIARARDQLRDLGDVEFVNARLEDVTLPSARYEAVFCASAIHWVDPDVSWRTAADTLVDGGTLALISYFGLEEPRTAPDQDALRAALAAVAPELAAAWPTYRDLDDMLAGVAARRANVSEMWGWLGRYDVGRRYVATLFGDAQVGAADPTLLAHTADELIALLGTMSFWARLSPSQRQALAAALQDLHQRLDRPILSSTIACLVTAPRIPHVSVTPCGAAPSNPLEAARDHPHAARATSATSRSFRSSASSLTGFPSATDAKPH